MGIKDVARIAGTVFAVVTTSICVAFAIVGDLLLPGLQFGFGTFRQILLLSGGCACMTIVFFSRRELSARQMNIRTLIHFVIILSFALSMTGFVFKWVNMSNPTHVIVLHLSIIGIYILTLLPRYFQAIIAADVLNINVRRSLRLRGKPDSVLRGSHTSKHTRQKGR